MDNGDYSRIRTVAASSLLDRNTTIVLRQSRRGYELYADGDPSPVQCETWPQARRVMLRLGVPIHRIDEINSRLMEGKGIVVRRRI